MKTLRRAPLVLALAALSACSVKAPPRSAWTIVTPADGGAAPAPGGALLGLARFSAAPEVRRTDLTWRSEEGRELHQTEDRWTDFPDRMLEEVVRARLLRSGRFAAVAPVPPSTGLDAVLHSRLLDFTEWHAGDGIEVRVALEWRLVRPGGESLGQGVARSSVPLPSRSVAGAVAAYQQASDDVAEQVLQAAADALRARR